MKKTYKIEVDCANCANLMEDAARKTSGVQNATVNPMWENLPCRIRQQRFGRPETWAFLYWASSSGTNRIFLQSEKSSARSLSTPGMWTVWRILWEPISENKWSRTKPDSGHPGGVRKTKPTTSARAPSAKRR